MKKISAYLIALVGGGTIGTISPSDSHNFIFAALILGIVIGMLFMSSVHDGEQ